MSLVFASFGIYRFCKYRKGFGEGLTSRLRQMRPSLEVAADTLHPEWRQLLDVIGQQSPRCYDGHPHEWVTMNGRVARPLWSMYPPGFSYQFIEESIIDRDKFGDDDPRVAPEIDPHVCQICQQHQSDDVQVNRCACFPSIFGGPKCPPPVQLFHTMSGKNNGVIARCVREYGSLNQAQTR